MLQKDSRYLFTLRGSVDPRAIVRLEGLGQLKYPVTSPGTETATFQLVAQCLNQLRYRVPRDRNRHDAKPCIRVSMLHGGPGKQRHSCTSVSLRCRENIFTSTSLLLMFCISSWEGTCSAVKVLSTVFEVLRSAYCCQYSTTTALPFPLQKQYVLSSSTHLTPTGSLYFHLLIPPPPTHFRPFLPLNASHALIFAPHYSRLLSTQPYMF
jgi:hypothetical protein